MGRTCRMVLYVILHACDALGDQLRSSGGFIAYDNHFASPILVESLAEFNILCVGTLKAVHKGVRACKDVWADEILDGRMESRKEKGDMQFR